MRLYDMGYARITCDSLCAFAATVAASDQSASQGEETRCDEKNQETFGEDSCPGDGAVVLASLGEKC